MTTLPPISYRRRRNAQRVHSLLGEARRSNSIFRLAVLREINLFWGDVPVDVEIGGQALLTLSL
jgi:hypothetical protein